MFSKKIKLRLDRLESLTSTYQEKVESLPVDEEQIRTHVCNIVSGLFTAVHRHSSKWRYGSNDFNVLEIQRSLSNFVDNKLTEKLDNAISDEKFIDAFVERINRKQLK